MTFVNIRDWNEGHRDICTGAALNDWTESPPVPDEEDLPTDTDRSSDEGRGEESKLDEESEVDEESDLVN